MTPIRTRLRRALCRHDWQAWWPTLQRYGPVGYKCVKCGVLRRVEP